MDHSQSKVNAEKSEKEGREILSSLRSKKQVKEDNYLKDLRNSMFLFIDAAQQYQEAGLLKKAEANYRLAKRIGTDYSSVTGKAGFPEKYERDIELLKKGRLNYAKSSKDEKEADPLLSRKYDLPVRQSLDTIFELHNRFDVWITFVFLIVALIFLSPTLTGNSVLNLDVKTSSVTGLIFFVLAFVGGFFVFNRNKN